MMIMIELVTGSSDWGQLHDAAPGASAQSRIITDVEEYALGYLYLFLRTKAGRPYSFTRADIVEVSRRRSQGAPWRPVTLHRSDDHRYDHTRRR